VQLERDGAYSRDKQAERGTDGVAEYKYGTDAENLTCRVGSL
jgi:hypothetical protein